MLIFDKETYFSLLFKFVLLERLSNNLRQPDVLLFPEFINILLSILYYNYIQLIILLYTFLSISFAQYKQYMICLISFRKFSGLLSPSTSVSAIGSLGTICLELDILRFEWTERP